MGTYYDRIKIALKKLADKIDPAGAATAEEDTFFDDVPESLERMSSHYGGGGGSGNVLVLDIKNCEKPSADGLSYEDAGYVSFLRNGFEYNAKYHGDAIILDLDGFSDFVCIDYGGYDDYPLSRFYSVDEYYAPAEGTDAPAAPTGGALALQNDVYIYEIFFYAGAGNPSTLYVFPSTAQFIRVSDAPN